MTDVRKGDWLTVAQVALESVINEPQAFAANTIIAVYEVAVSAGVSEMYVEMATPIVEDARREVV